MEEFFRAHRHEEGIFERECVTRGIQQSKDFFHAVIEWRTLFQVFVFQSMRDLTECVDSAEVAEVMDS